MPLNRRGFLTGTIASGGVVVAAPALAQKYPSAAPIRLIVPFAAAGPVDILARIIVDPLAKQLGQSIVIENRGGAGGNVGIAAAARARPDGYTLLLCSSTLVVIRCSTRASRSTPTRISCRSRCSAPRRR